MQYFVHGNDNQIYGPVDLATLQAWAEQGRIQPYSLLTDGQRDHPFRAAEVLPPYVFRPVPVETPKPYGVPDYRTDQTNDSSQVSRATGMGCVLAFCLFFGSILLSEYLASSIAAFSTSAARTVVIVGLYVGSGAAVYFGFRRRFPVVVRGIAYGMSIGIALVLFAILILAPIARQMSR